LDKRKLCDDCFAVNIGKKERGTMLKL